MGQSLLEALNVRVVGSGEKILVLAHGFGTDQSAWQRILPSISPYYYRVILYDLVCAGSVNPDYFDFHRYTTLDAYVDDLLRILDALAVDRCAYVGHSISAMIGILAAIRRPELFSPNSSSSAPLPGRCGALRFLNDRDYHGGFEQGEIEKVFSAMNANYEAWVSGFAPLAVGADVPAATAKDVSVPASVAVYLKNHLGGRNAIEMLPTEGHLPHMSAPGMLAAVLRRHLPR
ncbi:alpha/beta-Hydrolases superfamily protein [Actinidia rufa]|uniref:Alpha/beta-Hydrolases superfamily protein n=1 Tax=Actinidia rufa TaxID=165716 RepID=A0A7J0GHD9_9ERIC|nr:alpha/beta-Hydrolases superfamily protein [Actinidia rufa]